MAVFPSTIEIQVEHVDNGMVVLFESGHLDLSSAVAQSIVDEIRDQSLDGERAQRQRSHRAWLEADRPACAGVATDHVPGERIEIRVRHCRFGIAEPREIEELADRAVDVLDVLHDAVAKLMVAFVVHHFHREAYARERRAQIMRQLRYKIVFTFLHFLLLLHCFRSC